MTSEMEETISDAAMTATGPVKIIKPVGVKPLVVLESILKPTGNHQKTTGLVNHQKSRLVNQQTIRPGVTWSQIVKRLGSGGMANAFVALIAFTRVSFFALEMCGWALAARG
jgi:hypothetical protein